MAEVNVAMARSRFVMFLLSLGLLAFGVNGQSGSGQVYNVTITASPDASTYTVGELVTLMCMVDPPINTPTVTYLWQCDGCFANENTDMVIMQQLTDMDTSMINCSATVNGVGFTTVTPFDLQVQVPAPDTAIMQLNNINQRVGQDLTLECEVMIVMGISSTVDVVWIDNGVENRTNNVTFTPVGNSLRYTDTFTISPLSTSDDGRVIECLAVINSSPSLNGSSRTTLSPNVNAPLVMVTNTSTPTLNERLTIECVATTMIGVDTGVTFVWERTDDNDDEVEFRMMQIFNSSLNTDTNRLEFRDSFTIKMLNESHNDDLYKCTVTINVGGGDMMPGMANVSLEDLGIFVPTTIDLIGPMTNNLTVGDSLTLQCIVNTVENIMSSVDIVWRSDGELLERNNSITGKNMNGSVVYSDSYTFEALNSSDNGTLVDCEVVINVVPPVRNASAATEIILFVPELKVTISPPGPIQNATVGSPQVINCTVSTVSGVESSSVMIMWLDSEGNVIDDDGRVTISDTTSIGNNIYVSTLNFAYLMEGVYGDEGNYTCDVMILDASGNDSIDIESLIVPIPDVSITISGDQMLGQSPMLLCEVTTVRGVNSSVDIILSNSSGTVMEMNDTMPEMITERSRVYRLSYTFPSLTIDFNREIYTCEVVINSNPVVTNTNSTTLDVIVPPSPVIIMQSPERFVSGLDGVLTCTVAVDDRVPPPFVKVNWSEGVSLSDSPRVTISNVTYDGLQYTRMITFSPLLSRDGGQYTCSVSVDDFDEANNSNSVMIVVNRPNVTVTVEPPEINGNAADVAINLICTATSMENAATYQYQLFWYFNEAPVNDQSDSRIMINTNANMTMSTLFIDANDTMASDSGMYRCQVTLTIDGTDMLDYSDTSRVTLTEIRPPLEPVVTEIIPTARSVNISWMITSIVHDNETYTVYYGTDNMALVNSTEGLGPADVSDTDMYTVTISGLMPFTTYYFVVSAENSNGTTNTSVMTFRTNETAPDIAPQNFNYTNITATSITFEWDSLTGQGVNGMVRSYTVICMPESKMGLFMGTMGTINELSPFTNYTCTVLATTVMNGPMSDPITVRTAESAPYPPVINSVVGISSSAVRVYWTEPNVTNGVITMYTIFVNGSEFATVPSTDETQSYDITERSPYQLVTVTITATNGGETSDPSAAVSNRSSEAAPGIVEMVNINVATVTWEAPAQPNGIIIAYVVISYVYEEENGNSSDMLDPSTRTYMIPNLNDGVPYEVVVVAFTSAGGGEENDVRGGPFFTQQLSPTKAVENLAVMQLEGTTSVNVSWTPLTLFEAQGFPKYIITLTLSDSRKKRQSPLKMETNNSYVVFRDLSGGNSYSAAVGVTTGGENIPPIMADPISVDVEEVVSPTPDDGDDGPNVGGIVGGVIGATAGVMCMIIGVISVTYWRYRRRKSYDIPGTESSAAFINKRVVSPTESDEGGRRNDIAMQQVDHRIEQRLEPIPLKDFSDHVKNMHKDRDLGFEEEYATLSSENLASYDASQQSANVIKNRYANIFPYDFARVKVTQVDMKDDDTDYINASYMDGYTRTNAYIAAQGPLPETVKDFWQMVWDQKAPIIVMVTKLVEADIQKCEQYWPDNVDETIKPKPTLSVKLTQIQRFADYELRTMTVTEVSEDGKDDATIPLEVKQFFFTSWPDHGVPQFATALISFMKRVRQVQPKDGEAPLIVHCSAGVGRTGTYITLDTMLERMKHVDNVNVYECVRNLRAKRVLMVQTQAQYTFIHDALEELITCGDTSFNVQSMRVKVNRMVKVNPETEITGFQEQFQLLENVCRKPTLNDCADSQHASNKAKNRFENITPYDSTRVVLKPVSAVPGSDYINASRIDGYKERNAFIATQCPMENTVGDFWRMIWENRSAVIVLFCDPKHDEKDFTKFWPNDEEEHGQIKVTRKSNAEKNGYMVYKFSVTGPSLTVGTEPETLQVTMLHYTDWPNDAKPTNNTGLLAVTKDALELQRNTGNRAMTVVCSDGCGRTGTFIAIYYTIERLKVAGIVDIFQAIKNSRLSRCNLVSNLEQYESCHEVVLEFLDEFEAYANFK